MQHFVDIAALHDFLFSIYECSEGAPGRHLFKKELQRQLEFTEDQAQLYANIVLTKNSNGSADWVNMNACKLLGRWVHIKQHGGAGYLNSKTQTWTFNDDLTYEYKVEQYESALNLGAFYNFTMSSNPEPIIQRGIWAPSDRLEQTISVVIISALGYASRLEIVWPDDESSRKQSCTIDGVAYARR